MRLQWSHLLSSMLIFGGFAVTAVAQIIGPSSGEVTVRLQEGLDSAKSQPGTASHAVVTKSTNPAIPKNAQAVVQLGVDPSSGSLSIQLVEIVVSGQRVKTASTKAVLSGGLIPSLNSELNKLDKTGNQITLAGPHVFVPGNTVVQFTLTEPPPQPVEAKALVQPPHTAGAGNASSSSTTSVPSSPESGAQWTERAGKASDTGPNVITPGTLTFNGKTTPMFFYLACANYPAFGGSIEELRAVVPALPGLPTSGHDVSVKRVLTGLPTPPLGSENLINFNEVVHAGQYVVFYIQTTTEPHEMLAAKASPQETLIYSWKGQGSEGVLQLPLPPPNAAFNALLDRCDFIRDGNGKISEAFAKQLVPVLHEISALKPRAAYSQSLQQEVDGLEKLVKTTTEQDEVGFIKDELKGYIAQAPQTLKWKQCVQDMTSQAASLDYRSSKTCSSIIDAMSP